ncbi:hypothetical protein [Pseudoramibacter alactolyticus]|uniref:hypothetical protein n=1 Tax=Pseudoramibacter alactolyticus TaxID=113287 RepID=UPI0028D20866|nr:hypothetical protein [Pseudoramibacter alactolyticus]
MPFFFFFLLGKPVGVFPSLLPLRFFFALTVLPELAFRPFPVDRLASVFFFAVSLIVVSSCFSAVCSGIDLDACLAFLLGNPWRFGAFDSSFFPAAAFKFSMAAPTSGASTLSICSTCFSQGSLSEAFGITSLSAVISGVNGSAIRDVSSAVTSSFDGTFPLKELKEKCLGVWPSPRLGRPLLPSGWFVIPRLVFSSSICSSFYFLLLFTIAPQLVLQVNQI